MLEKVRILSSEGFEIPKRNTNNCEFSCLVKSMIDGFLVASKAQGSSNESGIERWLSGSNEVDRRRRTGAESHDILQLEKAIYEEECECRAAAERQLDELQRMLIEERRRIASISPSDIEPHPFIEEVRRKQDNSIELFRETMYEEAKVSKALVAAQDEEAARRADHYKMIEESGDRLTLFADHHTRAKLALRDAIRAKDELSIQKQDLRAKLKALEEDLPSTKPNSCRIQ
jgi:hypothetical protein